MWMMTGMFSRAAVSQIGASSGSLIFSRVPSAFFVSMPVSLKILKPMAPFFTSDSSCAAAFRP